MARKNKPVSPETEPIATSGTWIQRRRRHLGLTQKALASRAQCSVAWIKQIEQDRHPPGEELATALASALEIPPHLSAAFIRAARTGNFAGQPPPETLEDIAPPPAIPPLPVQPTRFFGRTQELGEIARVLTDPNTRLLTLLGPGGMGKTRLALYAAEQHRRAFDAVYFVSLREIESSDQIARAMADALQLPRLAQTDALMQVAGYLNEVHPKTLLVLDNFEHLMDGAEIVDALLERVRDLKIIVTSRERLRSLWETSLEIFGLEYPTTQDAENFEEFTAVQLFVERARRAYARFPKSEIRDVARICQLVQGHPLAIELAAAWVASFTCSEIAERIQQNIEVLKKQREDLSDAHRSVEATFDSSFALLSAQEQHVFCALGIFEGGFDPDAAAQVAGAERRLLTELVDKSLVQREGRRFNLHELLRRYAAEKLFAQDGEANATGARLFRYFLEYAQMYCQDYARLESEWTNFNTALRLAHAQSEWQTVADYVNTLQQAWETRGRFSDARHAFRFACEAAQARGEEIAYANALREWGRACIEQGDYDEAEKYLRESLQVCERLNERAGIANAEFDLARIATEKSNFNAALELLKSSWQIRTELKDEQSLAEILHAQARTQYYLGMYAEAKLLEEQALSAQKKFGDDRGRLRTMHLLAVIALHEEDGTVAAEKYCTDALELAEQLKDQGEQAAVLMTLAEVVRRKKQLSAARDHAEQSLSLLRRMGDQQSQARGLYRLSLILLDLQNEKAALQAANESLKLCRDLHDDRGMVYLLSQIGNIYQSIHQTERAQEMWREGYRIAQKLEPPHPLAKTLQENLRQGQ